MGNLVANNNMINKYFGILENLDINSKKDL